MTGSLVFPQVQAVPQVGRVALCVDGTERVGYEFGEGASRPFLFPVIGPSGSILTRLGHPNPIGHEHHKSVWFGHQSVAGINFWEERPGNSTFASAIAGCGFFRTVTSGAAWLPSSIGGVEEKPSSLSN